jgi:hypothetical protein
MASTGEILYNTVNAVNKPVAAVYNIKTNKVNVFQMLEIHIRLIEF